MDKRKFARYFDRCTVTEQHICSAEEAEFQYLIEPIWKGVDRPKVGGWLTTNQKLASRMQKAVQDGAAFSKIEVRRDINNKTYISSTCKIYWKRRASTDLKKLGY